MSGNILLVANYPSDTGYAWWLMQHFWLNIERIAKEAGKEVHLCYPKVNAIPSEIASSDIKVHELEVYWRDSQGKSSVVDFIKRNKIATIYFTDIPFFSFKFFSFRLMGVEKIIVHDHTPGDRPAVTGLKGAVKSLRSRLPWFNADTMFVVSDWMKQRNMSTTKVPERKCKVIQNGISPLCFPHGLREEKRDELGIAPNTVVLFSSGRANSYKRVDFIIRAVLKSRELDPTLNIKFLYAGDGPDFYVLEKMVREGQANDYISLLGFRDDIAELLCAADVAIHAALGEGFSLSITEYMSAGLAVLVPDIPSVSQAIDHEISGLVYSDKDVKHLAKEIVRVANDSILRNELGLAAQEKANNQYTINRCTQEFVREISLVI